MIWIALNILWSLTLWLAVPLILAALMRQRAPELQRAVGRAVLLGIPVVVFLAVIGARSDSAWISIPSGGDSMGFFEILLSIAGIVPTELVEAECGVVARVAEQDCAQLAVSPLDAKHRNVVIHGRPRQSSTVLIVQVPCWLKADR